MVLRFLDEIMKLNNNEAAGASMKGLKSLGKRNARNSLFDILF